MKYEHLPAAPIYDLQEGRYDMAVATSERALRATFYRDRVEHPDVTVTRIKNDGFYHRTNSPDPIDLMGYEAIGLPIEDAFVRSRTPGKTSDIIASRDGKERLDIRYEGDEVGIKFCVDDGTESYFGNSTTPTFTAKAVSERFARSPAHQAMHAAREKLMQTAILPETVSTEPFDIQSDPLGTLAFMSDIELLSHVGYRMRDGVKPDDLLARFPAEVSRNTNIMQSVGPNGATVYVWRRGWETSVENQLQVNVDGTAVFSVRQTPAGPYTEQANQSVERAVPFVETACARELSDELDRVGLMFHPKYQLEMMKPKEAHRFGSVYTQISREMAKWVDRPDRTTLRNLFVLKDPEYAGTTLANKALEELHAYDTEAVIREYENRKDVDPDTLEAEVRQKWLSTAHRPASESAAVLCGIVDDVLSRGNEPTDTVSDLPVTKEDVYISGGSCFDVVAYYLGAAGDRTGLRQIRENKVRLLEKTHGSHTFLSTEPFIFNSVRLPKGSLLVRGDDGKFAFTRLTAFAFDSAEDQTAAAGSELSKAYKNESRAISCIGGTGLSNIVAKAKK